MMTAKLFEFLLVGCIMGMVCVLGATLSGYLQALIAKNMGDDTAEQAGFLTLNPLAHVDFLGMIFLIYAGVGWSRHIPIDHTAITNRLKLAFVFFANAITYLMILGISLFTLIFLFGPSVMTIALPAALTGNISLNMFTTYYPDASSLLASIGLVIFMFIYISTVFAVLHFLMDGFRFVAATVLDKNTDFAKEDLLSFFLPILLIVFCAPVLRLQLLKIVYYATSVALSFLGGN